MRDFTLTIYKSLLGELKKTDFRFVTFAEFVKEPENKEKAIILRHDVDRKPSQSQLTAEIENELGIEGTYYFRVLKNQLPRKTIESIAKLGHEIGYHYDDLNVAGGELEKARESFNKNLAKLRELAPVHTVCMHGSPLSRYDNKDMWNNFNYHDLGIIGEPYFDVDFNKVLYLTDTGRRWDGDKVSIRDKVTGKGLEAMGDREDRSQNALYLHSTEDIINALKNDLLPEKVMLTIHPQRWTDNYFFWLKEFIWQNIKNLIKYLKIVKMGKNQKN